VLTRQAYICESDVPYGWDNNVVDFVNRLLLRKQLKRLGYYGIGEVKSHPWLKSFNWQGLKDRSLEAYFVPPEGDNFSTKIVNDQFKDENDEKFKEHLLKVDEPDFQD